MTTILPLGHGCCEWCERILPFEQLNRTPILLPTGVGEKRHCKNQASCREWQPGFCSRCGLSAHNESRSLIL
jgi:hypothetical protein